MRVPVLENERCPRTQWWRAADQRPSRCTAIKLLIAIKAHRPTRHPGNSTSPSAQQPHGWLKVIICVCSVRKYKSTPSKTSSAHADQTFLFNQQHADFGHGGFGESRFLGQQHTNCFSTFLTSTTTLFSLC